MKLNFKSYGDEGEALIILHGLFGMLDNWHSFAKKINPFGFKVYSIDQRNHGRSPWTDAFNMDLLADDLHDFMQQQQIDKAHFIGHSMGGKAVMRFALKYPQFVITQSIIDIGPKQYAPGHSSIFDALFSLDLDQVESRKDANHKLTQKIDSPSVVQFLLKNLDRKKDGKYQWKMNLKLLFDHYKEITNPIYEDGDLSLLPSLFVAGGKSNYITQEDHDLIDQLFPNNTIEYVEEAGHWIHAEAPETLLELIVDFIQ